VHRIREIFCEFDNFQLEKLSKYAELLLQWNGKINLISRRDTANAIDRHIIPCLAMARIGKFSSGESILDIGTGGGLPGIPLAIAFPAVNFTLLDSIGKKITAVEDMIAGLGLKNAVAVNVRAENYSGKFDTIVARAVANMADFLKYAHPLLRKKRILYLKGGDCSADLKLIKKYKLHNVAAITSIDALAHKVILEILE
jgi:16S rRNA (guanine527-N7)-methyltransferase